ncbi:MAG: FIVAR domain-containing protein [Oscillospiraceae bacterium]|nr:FIVAR domain-containing protein [Oscillospiraceae bacterium]
MKNNKKIISLIMALSIISTTAVPAFASQPIIKKTSHVSEQSNSYILELNILVSKASDFYELDYTKESYTNFKDKYNSAKEVLTTIDVDYFTINNAITSLNLSIKNLVFIGKFDRTKLNHIYKMAQNQDLEGVSEEYLLKFNVSLASAKEILLKETPTQGEINNETDNLSNNLDIIRNFIDKIYLKEKIDYVSTLDKSIYTDESFKKLETATQNAIVVYENKLASSKDILKATEDIQKAIFKLEEISSRNSLHKLLELSETFIQDEYTSTSWSKLNNAKNNGYIVFENQNSTEPLIQDALTQLQLAMDSLVEKQPIESVDKNNLSNLINQVMYLDEYSYTNDSWSNFIKARSSAEYTMYNASATQNEVNTALNQLQSAVDSLVERELPQSVDKNDLSNLIYQVMYLDENLYTYDSWYNFLNARSSAEYTMYNSSATQNEVNTALNQLQSAVDSLVEKQPIESVDKNDLNNLIYQVMYLDENLYTNDSWYNFLNARSSAEYTLYNDYATQHDVNTALNQLQSAVDSLVERELPQSVDKNNLSNLINQVMYLDENLYTYDTWYNFLNARSYAEYTMYNASATQNEVNRALNKLQSAVDSLVEKQIVDKNDLNNLINQVINLDVNLYTNNSWNNLINARSSAEYVLYSIVATQNEVNIALNKLQSAINSLVEKDILDTNNLSNLINQVMYLDSNLYTYDSWYNFLTARSSAEYTLYNEYTTQNDINIALNKLQSAIDNLVEKEAVDKTQLTNLINHSLSLNPDLYTDDSWLSFLASLSYAGDLMYMKYLTQYDIDYAVEKLQSAIDSLVSK